MKKLLIVLLLVLAVGCQKKYTRTPISSTTPDDQVTEEVMTTGPQDRDEEFVEEIIVAKDDRIDEESISIEDKAKAIFRDVLFDYDKYDIRPDARPVLDSVAAFLDVEKRLNIVIEGHCDERGTNEYNLALGEKRAKAAKKYLEARGVSSARMLVVTYGEEKPLCSDQADACWKSNRRAHFVVTK